MLDSYCKRTVLSVWYKPYMVVLKKPVLSIDEQLSTAVDELYGVEELSASNFGGLTVKLI